MSSTHSEIAQKPASLSERIWQKADYVAGLIGIAVLFGLIVFCANIEIKDLDLWLHLRMGQYIVQHHDVPGVDVLSCTIAGKPWVNHEWLFQVIAYLTYHFSGADGLITMQVMVVCLTFLLLLFLGYNKEKQLSGLFFLILVALVYQMRFTIRPDIFSLLFFALYIHVLALHLDKKGSLIVLVIIQILWANCHGFFFFGPLLVLIAIAAESLKRHARLPWEWNQIGRLNDEEFHRLKKILIVVVLASCINPQTFEGAFYPMSVLFNIAGKSKIFFNHIQELQSPFKGWAILTLEPFPHYRLLVLLSAVGLFLNRRKIDIGDLLLWLIFLLISVVAIRNLVYFAFVAYLTCVINFGSISLQDYFPWHVQEKKFQYMTMCFLKIFLIFYMIQFGSNLSYQGYFDFDKYELKSEFGGITQRSYPNKAVEFLVKNKVKGHFFNDFNSGAYLLGMVSPDIKVFIDGRTEVYGPEFFKYYLKIWSEGNTEVLQNAIDRYKLTGVLLNTVYEPAPDKLMNYLYKHKDWVLVYFGYDALIFLKDIPDYKDVITRYRIDLSKWKVPELDLQKLGPRFVIPYQNVNRAYSLESLGFDDQALAEAQAGLKVMPNSIGLHKISGKIYGKKNAHQKAFEHFRIAAMYASSDVDIRSNLALAYYRLGDNEHAIKQYNAIIRYQPKDPKAYFFIGKIYAEDKKYTDAADILKKAHQLNPKDSHDLQEIGDIVYKNGNYEAAKTIFEMASVAKKNSAAIYYKIGLCYKGMNIKDKAKESLRKALSLEPKNEEFKKSLESLK